MGDGLSLAIGIVLQTLLAVVFVDFLSGVLHWFEDSYGREDTPILGRYVVEPNIRHHFEPLLFTRCSFWLRNRVTWTITFGVLVVVVALGAVSWFWACAGVLGLLSNEIHCWAHQPDERNAPVIRWLQRWRLIQSPAHHARHHRGGKNTSYCVITDFLNPVLDDVGVFRRLERLIADLAGVVPRVDPSVGQARSAGG